MRAGNDSAADCLNNVGQVSIGALTCGSGSFHDRIIKVLDLHKAVQTEPYGITKTCGYNGTHRRDSRSTENKPMFPEARDCSVPQFALLQLLRDLLPLNVLAPLRGPCLLGTGVFRRDNIPSPVPSSRAVHATDFSRKQKKMSLMHGIGGRGGNILPGPERTLQTCIATSGQGKRREREYVSSRGPREGGKKAATVLDTVLTWHTVLPKYLFLLQPGGPFWMV